MDYFVTSFIEIARCISNNRLFCDAQTPIKNLFTDDFDALDFEMALCCFEATHRVAFNNQVWKINFDSYHHMSIEQFVETFTDQTQQMDPLFVTQRFLIFKEPLTQVMQSEKTEIFKE